MEGLVVCSTSHFIQGKLDKVGDAAVIFKILNCKLKEKGMCSKAYSLSGSCSEGKIGDENSRKGSSLCLDK